MTRPDNIGIKYKRTYNMKFMSFSLKSLQALIKFDLSKESATAYRLFFAKYNWADLHLISPELDVVLPAFSREFERNLLISILSTTLTKL